jgi:hypothetical protein
MSNLDASECVKNNINIASIKSAHALCTFFFTYQSIKEHFTSIVGLEGNRIYNCQFLQLRNNGFRIWKGGGGGMGNRQSLQNIIITILYHECFSHGMSIFNGNNFSS